MQDYVAQFYLSRNRVMNPEKEYKLNNHYNYYYYAQKLISYTPS